MIYGLFFMQRRCVSDSLEILIHHINIYDDIYK